MPAGNARTTRTLRPGATPEAELDALASVYAFLLKSRDTTRAGKFAPEPAGHNGAEIKEDSANDILPDKPQPA